MYKKLRIYYLSTSLPFIALIIGAWVFRQEIGNTLAGNPHPQINYAIFVLIVVGAFFILVNQWKLMQEGLKLSLFSAAVRNGSEAEKLQKLALSFEDADIAYVLRMIAASTGRAVAQREQMAIEHELAKTGTRLNNRHTLPQFMTNLLVGMGLLGTFIGLLATLGDIAKLISAFSTIDPGTSNPMAMFKDMVARMTAPMQSMGIAFSASLYGLLGSIILGFMMVSVRRCMQDIVSLLGSEVAQHLEFALNFARGRRREDSDRPLESILSEPGAGGTTGVAGDPAQMTESIRILRRIEERLAESSRLQELALKSEMDQFGKQRTDLMRVMADHSEAVNMFRSEMQRVGQQMGTVINSTDRGNAEMRIQIQESLGELVASSAMQSQKLATVTDLMSRMADDSSEARRLMALTHERGAGRDALNDDLVQVLRQAMEQAMATSGKPGPVRP